MSNLNLEKDIMKLSTSDVDKPLVSICCITFNQIAYIEETIKGFLIQETSFPFEILIHDDVSDDGTYELIRRYESKYPGLIRCIRPKSNRYSRSKFSFIKSFMSKAKGQYIAWCEGDDYWTDPNKLQLQLDKMREKGVDMSFHSAASLRDGKLYSPTMKYFDRVYSLSEVITCDFHFIQTNTLVFAKKIIEEFDEDFLAISPVADFFIRTLASKDTGALCIPKVMSVYRVQSVGSWTSRLVGFETHKKFIDSMLDACDRFDFMHDGRFSDDFKKYKKKLVKSIVPRLGYSKKLQSTFLKDYSSYLNFFDKVEVYIYTSLFFNWSKRKLKQVLGR